MWKIIGLIEGRSGALSAMPPELIGQPNEFYDPGSAQRAAQAMNDSILKLDTKTIRYTIIPAIDDGLHEALRGSTQHEQVPIAKPLAGWNIKPNTPPAV